MKNIKIFVLALIVAVVGFASMAGRSVSAGETANYSYLIGEGFLCDLDPSACPDISTASNGHTVEVTGSGTLSIHPKSVTGAGTFVHKDAEGDVLAEGTWTAEQLISFHSYGSGSVQGLPEELEGGLALIRVGLYVGGEKVSTAILQVDCLLGDKIPSGAAEGIRLAVQGAPNFNKEVSGFTVFVRE